MTNGNQRELNIGEQHEGNLTAIAERIAAARTRLAELAKSYETAIHRCATGQPYTHPTLIYPPTGHAPDTVHVVSVDLASLPAL